MELLLDTLAIEITVLLSSCSSLLHKFELFNVSLLLFESLSLNCSQFFYVFSEHLLDNLRLNVPSLVQLWIYIILTLSLYEEPHVLLDKVHSQDVKHVWTLSLVFN